MNGPGLELDIAVTIAVIKEIFADTVLPLATKEPDQAHRTGGWFAIWRTNETGVMLPVIGFAVGTVPLDRCMKYMRLANEKAERLSGREGDISSWQSRNPEAEQYGGAIRCSSGWILSFSGLKELDDETFSTLAGVELDLFDDQVAETRAICVASTNNLLSGQLAVMRAR